jgi:3-phosphoshikimate 1-carboxyvinyltransferase
LLGALAEGACEIEGFLPCNDCLSTLACVRALGIEVVSHTPRHLTVFGKGLRGLQAPAAPLHCHRSGTTMRLLIGILAGQTFGSALTGDGQLRRRPMDRVIEPLRSMGAKINLVDGAAAISIHGRPLHGQEHAPAVASAQLKSALLLAGLYADGPTVIRQPGPARDHTERMLLAMGAQLEITGLTVKLTPTSALSPCSIRIPGDLSSAAFPLVAATLVPDSQVTIVGVGSNPTRTGLLDVLQNMGGEVTIHRTRQLRNEPVTDVTIRTSTLHGVEIGGEIVVRMIDEFPALAVAATQALGVTVVRDAAELRTKETDRIRTIATGLAKMGARIEARPDGFVVAGPVPLHGAVVDSHGDHRLAMALVVAGLIAEGETTVNNAECVDDSFPGFVELMRQMGADISWQDG